MTEECAHNAGRITGIYVIEKPRHVRKYGELIIEGVYFRRILFNPKRKTKYKKAGMEVIVYPNGHITFNNIPVSERNTVK